MERQSKCIAPFRRPESNGGGVTRLSVIYETAPQSFIGQLLFLTVKLTIPHPHGRPSFIRKR